MVTRMNTTQDNNAAVTTPNFYDTYFIDVLGHIIDVRNIIHISPVDYERYEDEHGFSVSTSLQHGYANINIKSKSKEELEEARTSIVEAHKVLWMPYPTPTETNTEETKDV